jgi:hypothetical protein
MAEEFVAKDAVQPDVELERRFLEDLRKWWAESKAAARWQKDGPYEQLMVKGQTRSDLAAAAAKKKQDDVDAFLAKPMTDPERAAARDDLVRMFETGKQRDAKDRTTSWGQEYGEAAAAKVSFKKTQDGEWVFTRPGTNNRSLVTETYTGPDIKDTGKRETPLQAVIVERMIDTFDNIEKVWDLRYQFDRQRNRWLYKDSEWRGSKPADKK